MPQESLTIGVVVAFAQNQIFALPARRVLLFSDAAAPTFFQSTTVTFAASVAVTLTNGQAELAGGFIRCTNVAGNLILKALS